jgi:hypothetical protein
MCIACREQSLYGRQETIQCAKHWLQPRGDASSMLNKRICALGHRKNKKDRLIHQLVAENPKKHVLIEFTLKNKIPETKNLLKLK